MTESTGHKQWAKALDRARLRDRARKPFHIAAQIAGDESLYRSQRLCGVSVISKREGVEVRQYIGEGGATRAAIVGTRSCGGANGVCPVCTGRVREKRRHELEQLVARGGARGYRFALLTATLRHTVGTTVAQQRAALEDGWRAITTGKQAQLRKQAGTVAGTVRAIEFMLCGPHGPHGHVHAIVAIAPHVDDTEIQTDFEAMGQRWAQHAEENMGGLRPSNAYGFTWDVARNAGDVADYLTKVVDGDGWNITHELTRGDVKTGRGGSLAPLQLLDRAVTAVEQDGDFTLFDKFCEYARAVHGMRAIVVSRAFAKAMNAVVDQRTDAELANEPEQMDGWVQVGYIADGAWRVLVRRYGIARLLEIAARAGAPGVKALVNRCAVGPPPDEGPDEFTAPVPFRREWEVDRELHIVTTPAPSPAPAPAPARKPEQLELVC